jgi:hypothetical protein
VLPALQVSNLVIIKAGIQRLTMNGRLRLTLRPLMSQLPLIGSGAGGLRGGMSKRGHLTGCSQAGQRWLNFATPQSFPACPWAF